MKFFSEKIIKTYERVIREKMTASALFFLKELKYAIIGYGLAGLFVFGFEMVAGRLLGPEEYGKYVLVNIMGLFLYFFMTLGANISAIKYGAGGSIDDQKKIISAAYFVVILATLIFGLIFFIFSEKISSALSIPISIFNLSVVFGMLFALYTISTDSLRAIYNIKKLSFFRMFYGVLLSAGFVYFFLTKSFSFRSAVYIICFPYLLIFLLISFSIKKYFSLKINGSLSKIIEYGLYAAVGGSLFVFLPNISQIFVNKYLAVTSVGIYSAYYFSSITFALFFYNIFIVVFFPAASRHEKPELILNKIKKITPFLFLIGMPVLFVVQLVALNIYGSEYPISLALMLLFEISTLLICVYGIYSWFFYSMGISGVKKITALTIFLLLVDICLNFYLVPLLSLWGAIMATFFTYAIGMTCMYLIFIKKNAKIKQEIIQKKIKICHVSSSDLTPRFILLNLMVFLKKRGYEISVVCSRGKWIKDVESRGLKVKEILIKRKIFTPISDFLALLNLIVYFKKEKIDIVHTHTPKAGILGRIAAKISGVPIVIHTNHGFHFQENSSFIVKKFFIFFERLGAKFSDTIFSINKEDVETAIKEKICTEKKIKYSGDGIDINRFNPENFSKQFIFEEKNELGVDVGNKVIGFVGRLVEEKGILDLLAAFAIVKKNLPEAKILAIGFSEPEKNDSVNYKIFNDPKLKGEVIFLGEKIDLEKIYALMDVFVLPSHREGLGLVLLEASASGKPVVATNIRGCREAVDDGRTGVLVPARSPEKLAEAIIYILRHPKQAEEMGKAGRIKVVKEFDERIIFDRIMEEYEKLIRKKIRIL